MFGSIMNSFKRLKRSFRELHAALYFSTSPAFSPTPERIFLAIALYQLRRSSIGMSDWLIARIFSAEASSIFVALDIFQGVKTLKGNREPLSSQFSKHAPLIQGTWTFRPAVRTTWPACNWAKVKWLLQNGLATECIYRWVQISNSEVSNIATTWKKGLDRGTASILSSWSNRVWISDLGWKRKQVAQLKNHFFNMYFIQVALMPV